MNSLNEEIVYKTNSNLFIALRDRNAFNEDTRSIN